MPPLTLEVEHPPGYGPERRYALDAVLGAVLGVRHVSREAAREDVAMRPSGERGGALRVADVLFATPAHAWLTAAALPREPLVRVPAGGGAVPVLYATTGPAPELDEDEAWLAADVLGSSFFLLTRYEELVVGGRDAHARFPAAASVATREGFLDRPVVHEWADLLWAALLRRWPRLRRPARAFAVCPSHDVDWPTMPRRPLRATARTLAGDVVRRRDPLLAADRLRWSVAQRCGRLHDDPYDRFDELMATSEAAGVRSAFYFQAGRTDPARDGCYSLGDPPIARLLRRIHERGHEIGLHPSYGSFRRPEVVAGEFAALRAACARLGIEQDSWGGRQHYLRWENPTTWQAWEDAGLAYDATLTYAERPGFRTGACVEHPVFNLRTRRQLALRERPLVAMEGAVLAGGARDAAQILLDLREEVRRVRGDFTLLWHNSSLLSRRDRALYRRLVLG